MTHNEDQSTKPQRWVGIALFVVVSMMAFLAIDSMRGDHSLYSDVSNNLKGKFLSLSKKQIKQDTGVFTLTSTAAVDGVLGKEYTCYAYDGDNDDFEGKQSAGITPPMEWSNPPEGTKQFLLTMTSLHDGYDCPRYDWVSMLENFSASLNDKH
jgi:hypothetical protein